ncbi:MAG: diacylglycerol kinase family lipid kinase [Myxococcales bacterium]|nr:diacylglycerol kinase family lipid kinase [Myxococcales bacterium]
MSGSRSFLLIANPHAGGGRMAGQLPAIVQELTARLGSVTVRETTRAGHATDLAADFSASSSDGVVLSLGGDGTHNEVINGLLRDGGSHTTMALLHAGTGGDFRRLLSTKGQVSATCDAILSGKPSTIDAGRVTFHREGGGTAERFFLNIASLGMAGLVDRLVGQSNKTFGGAATYFGATLRAALRYQPAVVTLTVDGEDRGTFSISNLCVCNGQYAGSGMHFAPQARLTDGLFDVIVLRHASIPRSLPLVGQLYRGEHLGSPLVSVFRGSHIRVEPTTEAPAYMDIDGEAPGIAPAEFHLLGGALRVYGLRDDVL